MGSSIAAHVLDPADTLRPQVLAVGAWPAGARRLLAGPDGAEDLAAYGLRGGYRSAAAGEPWALRAAVADAGLRGRGGAGFPTATKLAAVAERPGPRHVVANAEEGEPASVKDRWLLRHRPHLVLDGLRLAGHAAEADSAHVLVSDREAAASIRRALDEGPPLGLAVTVTEVGKAYVAGEETAVVRAIDGGEPLPTTKPPRPFEAGVAGRPTAVLNAETLAHLPGIAAHGPAWFREHGTPDAPGTFLATISGAVARPGLYELPIGVTLRDAVEATAGLAGPVRGVLLAGYFGGVLGPRALDLPLDPDALRAAGTGLGCGAIILLGAGDCPVGAAADVMAYFARESSGQCGPCIRGTAAMAGALGALGAGTASRDDVEQLGGWSQSLPGRGSCGLLDGAAALAGALLRELPEEAEAHLAGSCPTCRGRGIDPDRFTVPPTFSPSSGEDPCPPTS
jgi:NADH:ubiquinone oxidoreductase subunit F (NADH-binding)